MHFDSDFMKEKLNCAYQEGRSQREKLGNHGNYSELKLPVVQGGENSVSFNLGLTNSKLFTKPASWNRAQLMV